MAAEDAPPQRARVTYGMTTDLEAGAAAGRALRATAGGRQRRGPPPPSGRIWRVAHARASMTCRARPALLERVVAAVLKSGDAAGIGAIRRCRGPIWR